MFISKHNEPETFRRLKKKYLKGFLKGYVIFFSWRLQLSLAGKFRGLKRRSELRTPNGQKVLQTQMTDKNDLYLTRFNQAFHKQTMTKAAANKSK